MTTSANPALGKVEDAVEQLGLFALTQVGLTALFTVVPVLGVWPLGSIIRGLTKMLAEKLFAYIRLVIDLKVIRFVNDQNQATFEREVLKLKVLARGYGMDSEEFKKGRESAKAALSNFVRFHGG